MEMDRSSRIANSVVREKRQIDDICDCFEDKWRKKQQPSIEHHLKDIDEPVKSSLLLELLLIDINYRRERGQQPTLLEYNERFPGYTSVIDRVFSVTGLTADEGGPVARRLTADQLPETIARYQVLGELGKGGFGTVYLGYDATLQRKVAIKVPHGRWTQREEDAKSFLAEAQILARLKHSNIVPVYDAGQLVDSRLFFVSEYVEGSNLAELIRRREYSFAESAELVATIAETLQYAHDCRVVHRDIKPANILIDLKGRPFVTDFGLAFKDEDFKREWSRCGTPRYMSPEQALGEGHRIDHRSDIFSLGVVCFELLTGDIPFQAKSVDQLVQMISTRAAPPPSDLNSAIPEELDRICLKSLSTRAADRYRTAVEMARDLRHYLADSAQAIPAVASSSGVLVDNNGAAPTKALSPDDTLADFVPRGLRSFEDVDAGFFQDLLPGPRTRDGIPESVNFWKTAIERKESEKAFPVGVIYGPSGCGKSSFVKAGLLPLLGDQVKWVYFSASGTDDEARLLATLRRRIPSANGNADLRNTLADLRTKNREESKTKTLIVLDQFELWLHGRRLEENVDLIRCLRQCDGDRLQCIVLIRDDFWMALTRFMRALEVPIVEGMNSAAVDLFDPSHARHVLFRLGRSYGRLPRRSDDLSQEQNEFLDLATASLTVDGQVIPFRLALLAEMSKRTPWVPDTLNRFGGSDGVTLRFLEETFEASSAPIEYRRHERAARAVLKTLLPTNASKIKGHTRSYQELLIASGYQEQPQEFAILMRVLDTQTRLLTPVDTNQPDDVDYENGETLTPEKQYHLTHDHLVQPLLTWLNRKQRESRRGRAQIALAERTDLWSAKRETQQLPSWHEYLAIRRFTRKEKWSADERRMMRSAGHRLIAQATALTVLILLLALVRHELVGGSEASALVQSLPSTDPRLLVEVSDRKSLPPYVERYLELQRWVRPKLQRVLDNYEEDSQPYLNAAIVSFFLNGTHVEHLYDTMLDASPDLILSLRKALGEHLDSRIQDAWTELLDSDATDARRLRAAVILAASFHNDHADQWQEVAPLIVDQVLHEVSSDPSSDRAWTELLSPIKVVLGKPLVEVVKDDDRSAGVAFSALRFLEAYGDDYPLSLLVDASIHTQPDRYQPIYQLLMTRRQEAMTVLRSNLEDETGFQKLGFDRQARLVATLLRLGDDKVWTYLRHDPNPELQSQIVHAFADIGMEAERLEHILVSLGQSESSIRSSLMLSLGALQDTPNDELLAHILALYEHDPDAGVHGAAEWLCRTWGHAAQLQRRDQHLATGEIEDERRWFVTKRNRHAMTVLRATAPFLCGTPKDEVSAGSTDNQVLVEIPRVFAICSKEVTISQFQQYDSAHSYNAEKAPEQQCPMNTVSWRDAARYCNWLSAEENIPPDQWCYVISDEMVRIPEDYLHRTGYRLPTSREWEYACRAGAVTSRYFGDSVDLLKHYEWYNDSNYAEASGRAMPVTMPVGRLKPNGFGLFDMLGNVQEWCYERNDAVDPDRLPQPPQIVQDVEDVGGEIDDSVMRVVRSGKYRDPAIHLRAGHSSEWWPTSTAEFLGFRIARTIRAN